MLKKNQSETVKFNVKSKKYWGSAERRVLYYTCMHEFLFLLKWFILGRTWTYRRPYARTRCHLWDSNP